MLLKIDHEHFSEYGPISPAAAHHLFPGPELFVEIVTKSVTNDVQ